jgi:putative flippase GtrA
MSRPELTNVNANFGVRAIRGIRGERPIRFLLAGGLNTVVGLSAYPILLWISPWFEKHYMFALAIAQPLCLIFAFTTYKVGVFRSRNNIISEFWKFCSYYAINYAANWIALPLLVEIGHIHPVIAQFAFAICLMIGSYFWHSNITFKPTPGNSNMPAPSPGCGDQSIGA